MRVDVTSTEVRRGSRAERFAVMLLLLAVGATIGLVAGALRPRADGTLSALAGTVVRGPVADSLPQLWLDVRFQALQALRERRALQRKGGLRPAPEAASVDAGARGEGGVLSVALGLAGPAGSDQPGELGRLVLDVRGEGDLLGMRALTLDDGSDPQLVRAVLLFHELASAGLLAPRVLAVGLRVNGERWGEAVAVEAPSTALLLAAHKPMGALVGWRPALPDGIDLDTAWWLAAPQAARWSTSARGLQGTAQESHTAWAQTRLDALRAGRLAVDDVVDIEATARLMALAELTALGGHLLQWQTVRWYLNPGSMRLEPVPVWQPDVAGPELRTDALWTRLLAAPKLQHAFATVLRAEAQRLRADAATAALQDFLGASWPTLPRAAWWRVWQDVRARSQRVLAAEQVPQEPVALSSALEQQPPASLASAPTPASLPAAVTPPLPGAP